MMDIVVPLRIVCSRLALRSPSKMACLVALIFYNEVNFPSGAYRAPNSGNQFREEVRRGGVNNDMNRVQSKSVKILFGKPIQGIVNKEVAHHPTLITIEIYAVAPRSLVTVGKE